MNLNITGGYVYQYLTSIITGVAADISHINTKSKVTGYEATPSSLRDALKGAEIVLIPAGVPRKPGMTRDGTNTFGRARELKNPR